MSKTKTQKEAKLVKKNANANVVRPIKSANRKSPIIKTSVKKSSKTTKKLVIVKVAPKTMRNRSGLHTINPRRVASKEAGVSVKVAIVDVAGVAKGNMTLPVEIFGAKPNKSLVAQAVRVYLANQRQGNASTQTRGEVTGSTRKIYRQKGTGRARHGALKAPIFVGGGIAHGPHPHDFTLDFPKKMRKAALIAALSEKAQAGGIRVVEGEFSGKTKEVATLLKLMELGAKGKAKKVLFVIDNSDNALRAAHNVGGLTIERAATLSTYRVVISKNVVFLKNSVDELKKRLAKN